jgi:uncharacterized protein
VRSVFTSIETSNKTKLKHRSRQIITQLKEMTAMHTNRIGAVVTMMFSAMLAPTAVAQENCVHPRIISVTGTAEIKLPPDEVQLRLGIDSHDKDLVVAKASNDQRIKKLMALAHTAGVEAKNIQTSALTMGPEYTDEKIPKLLGYQVSQTVAITLTDLSKYEHLMTGFLKAGVNRVDGIDFLVADPRKYREDARLKAVRAAREKAGTLAAELGQSLGKPWEITEESDLERTPYLNANFQQRASFGEPEQEAPTIAGGEVTIRSTVRVSFQLE